MMNYCELLGITPTGKNEDPSKLIDFFDDSKDLGYPDEHTNNFRFLSNFWPDEPFTVELVVGNRKWKPREYATGEHAYQAAKAASPSDFNAVADAEHPQAAKSIGRQIQLVPTWEQDKYDVMRQVLAAKFTSKSGAGQLLLSTGSALLVEGTWWYDTVWGVDLRKGGVGSNWLGVLLMARRAELYV